MSIFNKLFEEITIDDIQQLINHSVIEKQNLEYKRQTYLQNDKGSREMLRDITSFANAYGGYILIGIEKQMGDQ